MLVHIAYLLLAFSIIFGIVFSLAGFFYQGNKVKYSYVISIITSTVGSIGIIFYAVCSFMERNIFGTIIMTLLVISDVGLLTLRIKNRPRLIKIKQIPELEPIYERIREVDNKAEENKLLMYLQTRKLIYERDLVLEGWCTEEDLQLIKKVFKSNSKKEIHNWLLAKHIMNVKNNQLT